MANYSDKLALGEQALADFIYGKINAAALESKLSASLSSCKFFDRANTFTVKIVKNSRSKEPFFGARVYPALDLIDEIVESAVTELHPFKDLRTAWQKIDHWVIELDGSIFDRNVISLTPKEIMAMLLHEVGHTVFSDKVLERFYRAFKSMQIHMKSAEKDTIRLGYAIFAIPLATSCGIRSWTRGRNGIREEFFADKIVKDCGYGEFYISLLDKLISTFGNSTTDVSDAVAENQVSERCRWASNNLVDTVRRRTKLGNDLYIQSTETRSDYLHALYARVLSSMGVNLRERYSGDAVESATFQKLMGDPDLMKAYEFDCNTDKWRTVDTCMEAAVNRDKYKPGTPAFESILRRKVKDGLPSWVDIDRIDIEIDRMQNHNDRNFVLDMIYSKIDEINEFMEYVGADPRMKQKYEPEAIRMLERLEKQRNRVLDRKTFASRYSVFVKSPVGYDG